jgi:M6 family metalloprotease-like protein
MRSLAIFLPILALSVFIPLASVAGTETTSVPNSQLATASVLNYLVLSPEHSVLGQQTALIILVEFSDIHHTKAADEITHIALGELNSYFGDVSYRKVSITGRVLGWYTLNHPMGYYGKDSKNPGDDDNVQRLAIDAVNALPSDISLSSYEYLVIVHAGQDQAADKSKTLSDEIWSQCACAVFPDYATPRPVRARAKTFSAYAFLSEFNGVGTFAHEWGHLFGLPDLYDTKNKESYVGYWSLMDHGNSCCANRQQSTPSAIGGWGNVLLGWLSPLTPLTDAVLSDFDLRPLESNDASVALIPVSQKTYYFLEYRGGTGRDSLLPPGLLIYYVDEGLDSGQGILKLLNPATGTIFPLQDDSTNLCAAVFQPDSTFADPSHSVYVAVVGGANAITVLCSNQEMGGAFQRTSLLTSTVSPITSQFKDSFQIGGMLVGYDGKPLESQTVKMDILGNSGEWMKVGTTITDADGVFSFPFQAAYDVGEYSIRILYGGGKIGTVWYSSSNTVLQLTVDPAKMLLTISIPSVSTADRITLTFSVNDARGRPLPGAEVEIYMDGRPLGLATTDHSGMALFALELGMSNVGRHTVTAKASLRNYAAEQSSQSMSVIFPLWMMILIVTAAIAMAVVLERRTYRGHRMPAE